jgi:general stress protein 26
MRIGVHVDSGPMAARHQENVAMQDMTLSPSAIPDQTAQFETLRKLVHDLQIAMLSTVAADGTVLSRPVQTLDFDAEGVLWFATTADSDKALEIRHNPHVGLSYADRGDNSYVSISGPARLVRDQARIDALWSPAMSIFFPQGKDDPNLTLLRVEIERAEYWNGPGTIVGKMLYFAAAAITGNPGVMNDNAVIEPKMTA